jgi:hypothetical protein
MLVYGTNSMVFTGTSLLGNTGGGSVEALGAYNNIFTGSLQ